MMNGACAIEFFQNAEKNNFKTSQAGRDVFEDFDYIRIYIPGGKDIVERRVTDEDKFEYPKHWAQYEAKREQIGEGTPLEQWTALAPSQVAEWKSFKVFTVDQLAALSDANCSAFGAGATAMRKKAQAFLELASGSSAPLEKLTAENESLQNQLACLQEQFAELKAAFEAKGKK
jgi:hypothetical protein